MRDEELGDELAEGQLDRRTLVRRAAVLGAATAWATPVVQTLSGPAYAEGTGALCTASLAGKIHDKGYTYTGGPNGTETGRFVFLGFTQPVTVAVGTTNSPMNAFVFVQLDGGGAGKKTNKTFGPYPITQIVATDNGGSTCPDTFTITATGIKDGVSYSLTATLKYPTDANQNAPIDAVDGVKISLVQGTESVQEQPGYTNNGSWFSGNDRITRTCNGCA